MTFSGARDREGRGQNRWARWMLAAACLLAGCQGLRLSDAQRVQPALWPASGGTAARQNADAESIPPPLALTWLYNAEAGFGTASALVAAGYVFVGTRKGDVHAIRLETGKRQGYVSLGKSIEGASAFADAAFFGAVAEGKKPLFRYDLKAGRVAWRVPSEPILAGILLHDGLVVAGDAEGRVAAYSAADGSLRWEHVPEASVAVRAAPVLTPSGVLVADVDGGLRLFSANTGALRWEQHAGAPVYQTPAALGGHVFVATTRGSLTALDAATGRQGWHYAATDTTVRLTAPAAAGDAVVVAGTDGIVRMLDATTGAVRWATSLDDAVGAAPLLTAHTVYVGTMAKGLVALDRADGQVVWTHELRGRMKSALATADGSLIVLSEPRYVYRFSPVQPSAEL